MFFPAHFSLHLLQSSSTDYYLGLEDSSDLREQNWDHCTVSRILSLTDQIILRLIIDVKSLSNYWYARTTSSFLASSCNSGALVRSSVCKSVSIKHGLRTADYGLRTGYKIRTRYKTRTGKYGLGIKHGLGIKRGPRTTLVKAVLIVLGKEK